MKLKELKSAIRESRSFTKYKMSLNCSNKGGDCSFIAYDNGESEVFLNLF